MTEFSRKKTIKVEHIDGWGLAIRNYDPGDLDLDLPNIIHISSYSDAEEETPITLLWGDGKEELIKALKEL